MTIQLKCWKLITFSFYTGQQMMHFSHHNEKSDSNRLDRDWTWFGKSSTASIIITKFMQMHAPSRSATITNSNAVCHGFLFHLFLFWPCCYLSHCKLLRRWACVHDYKKKKILNTNSHTFHRYQLCSGYVRDTIAENDFLNISIHILVICHISFVVSWCYLHFLKLSQSDPSCNLPSTSQTGNCPQLSQNSLRKFLVN